SLHSPGALHRHAPVSLGCRAHSPPTPLASPVTAPARARRGGDGEMTGAITTLTRGRARRLRGRRGLRIALAAALVVAAPLVGRLDATGAAAADAAAVAGGPPPGPGPRRGEPAPLAAPAAPPGAPPAAAAIGPGVLPAGRALGEAALDVVAVATPLLPDGALPGTDDAIGARLTGPGRRGELLTDAGLTGRAGSPDPRGDLRVVTVPLADPAVADLLEPGDLVDLVGPTDPDAPVAGDPVARAARVTGVPSGGSGARSLLVEVPEADAARLAATAAGTPLAVLIHG